MEAKPQLHHATGHYPAGFIRPFDWSGDLPHALSGGGGRRRESAMGCSPQEALAAAANALLNIGCDDAERVGASADDELSAQLVSLATSEPRLCHVASDGAMTITES